MTEARAKKGKMAYLTRLARKAGYDNHLEVLRDMTGLEFYPGGRDYPNPIEAERMIDGIKVKLYR